jgi:hypothetical protein
MAYPPGGTFFDNKRSFVDVPVDESKDNAISTSEFLEAAEALTGLFDILGSVAFNPVKSDMNGNVKVRKYRRISRGTVLMTWTTENPRPPTNLPPRLGQPSISRSHRTRRNPQNTHRNRRPALAQPRPRLHRPSPPQKRQQPQRRTLQLIPRLVRSDAEAASFFHREADFQRRDERDAVSEGLLREVGG